MKLKPVVAVTLLCIGLFVGGLIAYFFAFKFKERGNFAQDPAPSLIDRIKQKNQNFAEAIAAFDAKNYDEAAKLFELALPQAANSLERAQILYKAAQAYANGSDPIKAVELFKEVAGDENAGGKLRAYAVQWLGTLLYTSNTPEVYAEVFRGEPYAGFLDGADYELAARRLFEYGSTFYKLGIPELRIAKWYSGEILNIARAGKVRERAKEVEDMKQRIREHVGNADGYLNSIIYDSDERWYVAEVLLRRAIVLGELALSGDTSLGNPDVAFEKAIARALLLGSNHEAPAKFHYARYLAYAHGGSRAADIRKLLEGFRINGPYMNSGMVRSLRAEKDNISGYMGDVLILARIDKEFAEFLRELGWKL